MSLFFPILIGAFGLSFVYVLFRLQQWSHWQGPRRIAFVGVLLLSLLITIAGVFYLRTQPEAARDWGPSYYLIYLMMGALVTLIFYTLFTDLLILGKKTLFLLVRRDKAIQANDEVIRQDRRRFLSIGTLTMGSVAVGAAQGFEDPKINHVLIKIKGLPKEFSGFKIAQISDLHVGPLIRKDYVQRVVALTNALGADVIALTGDIADAPLASIKDDVSPLSELRGKEGVFYITGNHEYYWGADEWISEFRRLGAQTLLNQHVVFKRDSAELVLAGINDADAGNHEPEHVSDPHLALESAPEKAIKILLAHQPKSFKLAHAAKADLQLSGHTHGGQFFPWSLIVALAQPYYRGLNQHENMWIYTSTGTGFWGPPMRLGVPKEIALIELQSDS